MDSHINTQATMFRRLKRIHCALMASGPETAAIRPADDGRIKLAVPRPGAVHSDPSIAWRRIHINTPPPQVAAGHPPMAIRIYIVHGDLLRRSVAIIGCHKVWKLRLPADDGCIHYQ